MGGEGECLRPNATGKLHLWDPYLWCLEISRRNSTRLPPQRQLQVPVGLEAPSPSSRGCTETQFLKGPSRLQILGNEFPVISDMTGMQTQTARCLSPLLLTKDCPHFTLCKGRAPGWQIPLQEYSLQYIQLCPAPAHFSHLQGLWENRPVHLLRSRTQCHLLVFPHRPLHDRVKQKLSGFFASFLWFLVPLLINSPIDRQCNFQAFWLKNLSSRSILQDWYYAEHMLRNDVSFK